MFKLKEACICLFLHCWLFHCLLGAAGVAVLEERLGRLKGEKVVLSEELASSHKGQQSLERERAELVEKLARVEKELCDIQTTLSASNIGLWL